MDSKKSKLVARIISWVLCVFMVFGSVGTVGYYIYVYFKVRSLQNQVEDVTPVVSDEVNVEDTTTDEIPAEEMAEDLTTPASEEGEHVRIAEETAQ